MYVIAFALEIVAVVVFSLKDPIKPPEKLEEEEDGQPLIENESRRKSGERSLLDGSLRKQSIQRDDDQFDTREHLFGVGKARDDSVPINQQSIDVKF